MFTDAVATTGPSGGQWVAIAVVALCVVGVILAIASSWRH